jgi:hypothetical protein
VQGAGRRLSSFKLSCNLFGIIPAVNSTGGTVQVVCSCHILTSLSVQSLYFCSFSVMVLRTVWLLAIAISSDYASLTVLSSITMPGLLLWTVLSVIIDLSQYSLQLQLSATDCGPY